MKIKQTKVFCVNSFFEPYECDVLIKDDKIFLISDDNGNNWEVPNENFSFFDTKEEAEEFFLSKKPFSDAKLLKAYIEFLADYGTLSEVLPETLLSRLNRRSFAVVCTSYDEKHQLSLALRGILNIDGKCFRASEVEIIKYGNYWLELILKNGEKVTPNNETEIFIIESIFGENRSQVSYTTIGRPKTE